MTAVFSLILCGQLFCSVLESGLTANDCADKKAFYSGRIREAETTYCIATKYLIKGQ